MGRRLSTDSQRMRELANRRGGASVSDAMAIGVRQAAANVYFSQHAYRGNLHVAYHVPSNGGRLRGQYFVLECDRDAWRDALPLARRPNAKQLLAMRGRSASRGGGGAPRGSGDPLAVAPPAVRERAPEAVAMHLPPLPTLQPPRAFRVLPELQVSMEAGFYMRQWHSLRGGAR